jgi:putative endonuclease
MWRQSLRDKSYYVYIMASQSRTLYIGVTNNLEKRVYQHKHRLTPGFTSRYNINKLVYYAETNDVTEAITREKELKGWLRKKKKALIEEFNPTWEDLSSGWYDEVDEDDQRIEQGDVGGKGRDSSLRSE